MLHEVTDGAFWVVDQRHGGIDDLTEVVRWDVGRHPHRDTGGAVHKQRRELGGKNPRFLQGVVVVGGEVDRFLVDVGKQLRRQAGHSDLGVPHCRRRVAVERAEVPLAINEDVAHGEVLRHTDNGVVDRLVTVWVVLTNDVADDTRALFVCLVPAVVELLHGEEHAPVNRFEPVADIR